MMKKEPNFLIFLSSHLPSFPGALLSCMESEKMNDEESCGELSSVISHWSLVDAWVHGVIGIFVGRFVVTMLRKRCVILHSSPAISHVGCAMPHKNSAIFDGTHSCLLSIVFYNLRTLMSTACFFLQ